MTEHEVDSTEEAHEQVARVTAFMRRALRFWGTPAVLLVLGLAACAAFLVVRSPTFRSETVILYSEGVRGTDDADRPNNARGVTLRLKEILMSRASLDEVVQKFDLYPEIRQKAGAVDAVEELRKHVEFRAPGGDTFSIAFTGASPSEAQAVTARLAALVIGQDSDLRKKQATLMRDFLETEKQTTEARLRDTETALAFFMAAHPRFALDATPLATGAAIRASLGAAAAVVPVPGGAARPRTALPARDPRDATTPVGGKSPAPDAVVGREAAAAEEARANAALAAARASLADLSAHFTPAHPDVRAAQAEVDRATSRLALATAAALAAPTARPSAPPARSEEATLSPRPLAQPSQALAQPSQALAQPSQPPVVTPVGNAVPAGTPSGTPRASQDVVALETEWVKLTRGVTEARQHQDEVEGALFKANTAVSSESGGHGVQVTMIDPAFLPQTAVPPGRVAIVALFVAGALLLGVLGAFLRAFVDDRVYDARDVTRFARLLVEVPRASSRRAHVPS
jgi:capsular polysaccharide biosynthesis protein